MTESYVDRIFGLIKNPTGYLTELPGGFASGGGGGGGGGSLLDKYDGSSGSTPQNSQQTWTDPATGAVYRITYDSMGNVINSVLLSAGKPPPPPGGTGTAPIGYGEPFQIGNDLYQVDSRGQYHKVGSLPGAAGPEVQYIGGGQVMIVQPDGSISFQQVPGGTTADTSKRQIVTNNQTGQQFWVDPATGATEPVFGGSSFQSASPYLRSDSGGGGGITSGAINALAKLMGGGASGGGGGGGSSAVDPNIGARESSEINIMNKRFELDRDLALINLQIQLGLIDKQQGERMMDRAIDAAGFAAGNRLDIANFNRQVLQDKLGAAAQLSNQINDVNPAKFNAWLLAGGGDISSALAGAPEGPLDDLTALPAARTLQSIRQTIEPPAPYDPLEFLSQFQGALPAGGTGTGGINLSGLDLGSLFGGITLPGGSVANGAPAAGGVPVGQAGGAATGGAPDGTQIASGGNPAAGLVPVGAFGAADTKGVQNGAPLMYQATNGGYITAGGAYIPADEGTALAEMMGVPTGIDPIGFRQTDLYNPESGIVGGLNQRIGGILGTGAPLLIDTGGTGPVINPNLFAGMSDFEINRAKWMMEVQGFGGWLDLATQQQPAAQPAPGGTTGTNSNIFYEKGAPGGTTGTNSNIFYAKGTPQGGTTADTFVTSERGPEVVSIDYDRRKAHVIPNHMLPAAMQMMKQGGIPGFASGTDAWSSFYGSRWQPAWRDKLNALSAPDPTPIPAPAPIPEPAPAPVTQPAPTNVTAQVTPASDPIPVPQPIIDAATQPPAPAPAPTATSSGLPTVGSWRDGGVVTSVNPSTGAYTIAIGGWGGQQITKYAALPAPAPAPAAPAAHAVPPTSAPVPPVTPPATPPAATNPADVIAADPFTDIIMPSDRSYLDEILNLRRNTQLPGGVNPFAADLFQRTNPITLAAWLQALQTQKGIPAEASLFDMQRYAPAGVDIGGIRTGV